jgi:hypothetical protein
MRALAEEHGAEARVGPPPLAVLCVRALHRAGPAPDVKDIRTPPYISLVILNTQYIG